MKCYKIFDDDDDDDNEAMRGTMKEQHQFNKLAVA